MLFARFGKTSLNWTPGTAVAIGLNSPRTSVGASGLGSNVSMCDAPPASQIRMQFRALVGVFDGEAPRLRSRNRSSIPRPRKPRTPALKIDLREGPAQTIGGDVRDMGNLSNATGKRSDQ